MALFTEIHTTADLPTPGTSRESMAVDFKKTINAGNPAELAKDVAAFANVTGGVVLVGADEDTQIGALRGYVPLTEPTAQLFRDAYNKAAATHCSPSPIIEPVIVTSPPGSPLGYVVAVNVWPFPAQAVGVDYGGDKYRFPARIGTHPTFLTPEQLPMLMIPELRYNAILLSQIPNGKFIKVLDDAKRATLFNGLEVKLMESSVTFREPNQNLSVNVPLAAIKFVWVATAADTRMIQIAGRIHTQSGVLEYYPPGQLDA